MLTCFLPAVLWLLLSGTASGADETAKKPKVQATGQLSKGTVNAVAAGSITLRHDNGRVSTFRASKVLVAGGFSQDAMRCYQYRLSDVRVGDVVALQFSRIDNVEYCDEICIFRRPGGKVPPSPGELPHAEVPHHELCNLLQELEDKGLRLKLGESVPEEIMRKRFPRWTPPIPLPKHSDEPRTIPPAKS